MRILFCTAYMWGAGWGWSRILDDSLLDAPEWSWRYLEAVAGYATDLMAQKGIPVEWLRWEVREVLT